MHAFSLDADHIAIRDMARAFADDRLAPRALEWDEKKHFPVDVIREAAALGMAAIYVREDVGGSAMTRFDAALIFEALSTGCPAVAAFVSIPVVNLATPLFGMAFMVHMHKRLSGPRPELLEPARKTSVPTR